MFINLPAKAMYRSLRIKSAGPVIFDVGQT